LKHNSVHIRRL